YRIHGAITEEMAERLLDISMAAAEADCRNIYPGFDQFSERRKDALVDFVFNLGAAGALKFRRMRAAIIAGDWLEAARQLNDSAYWRQLGGDPAGTDDGKLERPEELYRMLVEG
ncbi:MAG TPA: glycoside hydrolase family protein, partial [Syntrophales bacterium]|nr:glycoside hydrolase family protein [Syntrophales bacterium]